MRIVQLIPDFDLGGVQKGGCVLAAGMAKKGHEAVVIGLGGGPRFRCNIGPMLSHQVLKSDLPASAVSRIIESTEPDVVHIHRADYWPELTRHIAQWRKRPLIVTTPVFGRVPHEVALLDQTRTCHVGVYTFHRFCRWMGWSYSTAVSNGVAYVPITPFEPTARPVSALDSRNEIVLRRQEFGIPPDAFVVGRVGRQHISKWHPSNAQLVQTLLQEFPRLHWLSVGFPIEAGRQELQDRWPKRFHDLPETPDYELLLRALSAMDVQAFFGHGECFASSIAEAAGAAVPTVALANPLRDNGQSEQVRDGVTGFLVASVAQAVRHVQELIDDPLTLATMKRRTQEHCLTRWHVDRATNDLLELYEFWRNSAETWPPYARVMLQEARSFGALYNVRISRLMGCGPLSRYRWRLLLRAVESRAIWQTARAVKRVHEKMTRKGRAKTGVSASNEHQEI